MADLHSGELLDGNLDRLSFLGGRANCMELAKWRLKKLKPNDAAGREFALGRQSSRLR